MSKILGSTVMVDCCLSNRGRQILAQGDGQFKITRFALSDDGVDYALYNPDDARGSDYYGEVIENTPLMEAATDETIMMRNKLISLPKNTRYIPYLTVQPREIGGIPGSGIFSYLDEVFIKPGTERGDNAAMGYTVILSNTDLGQLSVVNSAPSWRGGAPTVPYWMDSTDLTKSIAMVGTLFKLIANDVTSLGANDRVGKIVIYGNQTGGIIVIPVTVSTPRRGGKFD